MLLNKQVYEFTFPTFGPTVKVHPSLNHISCSGATDDGLFMVCGNMEGEIILCRLSYSKGRVSHVSNFDNFFIPATPTLVCISAQHFILCAAYEKTLIIYDYGIRRIVNTITTESEVQFGFIDDNDAIIVIGEKQHLEVFSVNGNRVHVKNMEGLTCGTYTHVPYSIENRCIVLGQRIIGKENKVQGHLIMLNIDTFNSVKELTFNNPIKSIHINEKCTRILVNTEEGIFTLDSLNNGIPLKKQYAYSCAICKTILANKQVEQCPDCGRFLCQKCKFKCHRKQ